jgi:hypothetical protein
VKKATVGGYVQTYEVPGGTREVWVPVGYTWSAARGLEAPWVDPVTAARRARREALLDGVGRLVFQGPLSLVFLPVWIALFLVAGPVLILAACLAPAAADELSR